eukprot:5336787-Prymnesium_polylepis.1
MLRGHVRALAQHWLLNGLRAAASASRCADQLLHLPAPASKSGARRLHLMTMRYILHPHRRTALSA